MEGGYEYYLFVETAENIATDMLNCDADIEREFGDDYDAVLKLVKELKEK